VASLCEAEHIHRDGQNRIYAPYMTVYFVISQPNLSYIHRIYMVLANFTHTHKHTHAHTHTVAASIKLTECRNTCLPDACSKQALTASSFRPLTTLLNTFSMLQRLLCTHITQINSVCCKGYSAHTSPK